MSTPRVLSIMLLSACGLNTYGLADGESTSGPTSATVTGTDATITGAPTSTSIASADTTMGVLDGPTTSGSTASTADVSASATDSYDTSSGDSTGARSSTGSTGTDCPAGTVICEGGTSKTCNGEGGYVNEAKCEYVCLDGSGCGTCEQAVAAHECPAGLPRIMVLLDASSSMLNTADAKHAPAGAGRWDQTRDALAGAASLFDVDIGGRTLAVSAALGLAVFGFNAPSEEKLVVQYGACHQPNFAWALDPWSSCVKPGCTDPYGPPPIAWTFQDGAIVNPPKFADKTLSHMPRCDHALNLPNACVGSGTYTHLGLNLIQSNLTAYKATCKQLVFPCTAQTEFVNILITDGDYNSTDAQVQGPLTTMFNNGITTYVIGFGDLVDVPASVVKLNNMAKWGSGNTLGFWGAKTQNELADALAIIISQLNFC